VSEGKLSSPSLRTNSGSPSQIGFITRTLAVVVFAVPLALAGPITAGTPRGDAVIRGAYLAAAAGCDQCHTNGNSGRAYAGGRIFETPLGIVVSTNITPDRETGIGRWQFSDLARAIRWGIAPDDSHYLPGFPFRFYNRLTDDDLTDLVAFLKTVQPVSQVNQANGISFISAGRARGAIAVAAEAFPGPLLPDPSKDAAWNRGAYLVATVGRCGDCHTPRNILGAFETARLLAGSSAGTGGKVAPNITPDPETGIGRWSEEDIVNLLKDGQTPNFDFVGGAMAEIVRNTSRLDNADRHAIAVYLRTLAAIRSRTKGR
jgi:mono/diheme cytochrome c family protein